MTTVNRKTAATDLPEAAGDGYATIRLQVPEHLAVAWQRCSWVLVEEKGQGRLESMEEMVRDFLIKHGC
jgi:hypothetical protein